MFAPAMHPRMWSHPATRANVDALVARGAVMVGPVDGPLASGESGMGRMADPEAIVDAAVATLAPRDLTGARVLVTAGGTHEAIDPVRFVGNRSSGRMGYAVAEAARDRGAAVTLVSGPTAIAPPAGVEVERVRSAMEMQAAVSAREGEVDVVVMAAAVADYRPAEVAAHKIKKGAAELSIRLVANPDILASLGASRAARRGARPVLVGFAVETGDLVALARGKLSRKGCDLVVANRAEDGFEGETNRVVLVDAEGDEALPVMPKREVAHRILDRVVGLLRRPE
ncbi:MAG: bifunctional phosphopantothenoylcysteine decarboxylase/phosphopantothenate--cysteine ligase CoaBC [Polyangiales bacterium]